MDGSVNVMLKWVVIVMLIVSCCSQSITVSTTTATTTEDTTAAGNTVTFTVVLATQPMNEVTIPISSGDVSEGTVSPGSVVFTTTDWNVAQQVTVTGVNDNIDDGNIIYTLSLGPSTSSDNSYSGLTSTVAVTNTDDDTAGIAVTTPSNSATTTEGGTSITFTVSLESEPIGTGASVVSISMTSSDTTEGVVSPSGLTFTSGNWFVFQTVTITGQNDDVQDGDVNYNIQFNDASSTDPTYDGMTTAALTITNTDDDTAGVSIAPTALLTSEPSSVSTFTLVLDSEPLGDVTIPVVSGNLNEGTVLVSQVIFKPTNWNTIQTVTVNSVDDDIADGSVSYSIELQAITSPADTNYNNFNPTDVTVVNADNDAAGVTVSPTTGLITSETSSASPAYFTIKLNSQPVGDVIITPTSSLLTEGTVTPTTLTFTSVNWNSEQSVTVTGADDNVVDGAVAYSISLASTSALDPNYVTTPATVTASNTDDDVAGVTVTPLTAMETQEATTATVARFSVVLDSQPTGSVTIPIHSENAAEGVIDKVSLTFTSADWNAPQEVSITGIDDNIDDGNVVYQVAVQSAASSDPNYSGFDPTDVTVTNIDDDTADITVSQIDRSVSESGTTGIFTVVLASEPTAEVTLSVSSSDVTEGVCSHTSVVFTPLRWNIALTVTVTGVDDNVDDGDVAYVVTLGTAVSSDPSYSGFAASDVAVTTLDDDTAGVTIAQSTGLTTTESGGTAQFTIVLNSEPSGAGASLVTIPISSSNILEGTVAFSSYIFTSANWQVPQTVTVTGVDDNVDDGDTTYSIVFSAATSTDSKYDAYIATSVSVTNTDDDTAGIVIAPNAFTISEPSTTQTFTVVLNSKPIDEVTIPFSSTDLTEGFLDVSNIIFRVDNWNVEQTVSVTAVNDDIADGSQVFQIQSPNTISNDASYNSITASSIDITTTDNDVAGISLATAPTGGVLSTSESSTSGAPSTASFSLVLDSEPTSDVTVTTTTNDVTEGEPTAATQQLIFNSLNWNIPQQVTITGLDDNSVDGTVSYIVTCTSTSQDSAYRGLTLQINAQNSDNDSAGVSISRLTVTVFEDAALGSTETITVVLDSEPTDNVAIAVISGDSTESIANPTNMIFTSTTWNVAQTITITAVDDQVDDGDVTHDIVIGQVTSSDASYRGFNPPDISVTTIDNDMRGITVSQTTGLVTSETGTTATFTVVLDSMPSDDVEVTFSSDLTEVSISPSSLVFTPATWNLAKAIVITGIDDQVADGDILTEISSTAAVSSDPTYSGLTPNSVFVTNSDDDTASIIVTPISVPLQVSEAGLSSTFGVVLGSKPEGNVLITYSVSDNTEASLDRSQLTFTPTTWSLIQTITVVGLNDDLADGDQTFSVDSSRAVSSDNMYATLSPHSVNVLCSDDDSVGVVVTPTTGIITSEDASSPQNTATFTVLLATQPAASVQFSISVSIPTEAITNVDRLTFTSANYNTPQTVTVTGVDDLKDDDSVTYSIQIGPGTGGDPQYVGFDPDDVSCVNLDNDNAGVLVTPTSGLIVSRTGTTTEFTVVLSSEPDSNVQLSVQSEDTTEGTVSTSSVAFTTSNWNVPQTVIVTGVDDNIDDGNQVFIITLGQPTGDPKYSILSSTRVTVTNVDDDTAGITVAASSSQMTTTESGGQSTFTISLTSMPAEDVTINLQSSDMSEGTPSPSSVTFTQSNWLTTRIITITGQDDSIDDGDIMYTIIAHPAQSNDAKYRGMDPQDISITNIDNDSVGLSINDNNNMITSESGTESAFGVQLSSEPTDVVTVTIEIENTSEGEISNSGPTLTFTTASWNVIQSVTIKGVDDNRVDGDVSYDITLRVNSVNDAAYRGISSSFSVTNTDDDVAGYIYSVVPSVILQTTEAGGSSSLTVKLQTQPSQNVIISYSVSDTAEAVLNTPQLTFTPNNWNAEQLLIVTGRDDFVDDGDVTFQLTASVSTTDLVYTNISPPFLTVTNTDDDVADVAVSPNAGLQTSEDGTVTSVFTVVLKSKPLSNSLVSIPISSSLATEGTPSALQLQFTGSNWNISQTITVSGTDDDVVDGPIDYSIIVGVAVNYHNINPTDVQLTNIDNDVASLVVNQLQQSDVVDELGSTTSRTVRLQSKPSDSVTIPLTVSDDTEISLNIQQLLFTTVNWNILQTIIVSGLNDDIADGVQSSTVQFGTPSSTDAMYSSLSLVGYNFIVQTSDDDAADFTFVRISGTETAEDSQANSEVVFEVGITSEPTAMLVFPLSVGDDTEAVVSPSQLTFTSLNWRSKQTLTVTGKDDQIDDGDVSYSVIVGKPTTTDVVYNSLSNKVIGLRNIDDDSAYVEVSRIAGITTYEDQSQTHSTVLVSLLTEPTDIVTIPVSSSNDLEATVDPTSLRFEPATWQNPQTITIKGIDDQVADGDVPFRVTLSPAISNDVSYKSFNPSDITAINIDNDSASVLIGANLPLSCSESGTSVEFTLSLSSKPTSLMSMTIQTSDTTEGIVSPTFVTFSQQTWNTLTTVTITCVNDDVADGDVTFTVRLSQLSGSDATYSTVDPQDLNVMNIDNDVPSVIVTTGCASTGCTQRVSEDGISTTAKVILSLASRPLGRISIPLASDRPTEGTPSQDIVVFTPSTWNIQQTVTVRGADDLILDGDQLFNIEIGSPQPASSADVSYGQLQGSTIPMTCVDDDVAGVVVTPVTGLVTSEAVPSETRITVMLRSAPSAGDVVLPVTTDDDTEGTVSPSQLTFTPSNSNIPQTVTINGVDDDTVDGDVGYSITIGVPDSSSDPSYITSIQSPTSVSVRNLDNDVASVTVAPYQGLITHENGLEATFTVVLNARPSAEVIIPISSSDVSEGRPTATQLAFDGSTWSTPQTVTIKGQPDSEDDTSVAYTITLTAASMDSAYHGLVIQSVSVVNEPLNCMGFSCPAGMLHKSTSFCPGASCSSLQCCIQTCVGYACSANSVLQTRTPLNETMCLSGSCSDSDCCITTCGSMQYSCPTTSGTSGFILDTAGECIAGVCSDLTCCKPACSSHTCLSSQLKLKQSAASVPCASAVCTDAVCCDETCLSSGFSCPAGYVALTSPADVSCPNGNPNSCGTTECCEATCLSYTCASGLARIANAGSVKCTTACSDSKCCEDLCLGVACTASDSCHEPSTCNTQNGLCEGDPIKADGSVCDDGDSNTATDTCKSGACIGRISCGSQLCPEPSDLQCTSMTCSSQQCTEVNKPANTACNDGNDRTVTDVCVSGACVGSFPKCNSLDPSTCALRSDASSVLCPSTGCDEATCCQVCSQFDSSNCLSTLLKSDANNIRCLSGGCDTTRCCLDLCTSVICTASDQCHNIGVCDGQTGLCSDPIAPDNRQCTDGIGETTNDVCENGVCVGSCAATNCKAQSPQCNRPVCSNVNSCTETPKLDSTPCNDGDIKTNRDQCILGVCVGTLPTCASLSTQCVVVPGGSGRTCAGLCRHRDCCILCNQDSSVSCPAGQTIKVDTPCPASGCSSTSCCEPDKCTGVQCLPADECREAGICNSLTGLCSTAAKTDGTRCNDADSTTSADRCTSGVCRGTANIEYIGGLFIINSLFSSLSVDRTMVLHFQNALTTHLTQNVPGINNIMIQSICESDAKGNRIASTCIPGTVFGQIAIVTSRHVAVQQASASGYTFVHAIATVPASLATTGVSSMKSALQVGTGISTSTVIAPELSVSKGRCASVVCDVTNSGCFEYLPCDEQTGSCSEVMKPDGTTCDDTDSSTLSDVCSAGSCSGHILCDGSTCKPQNPECQVAVCSLGGGCGQSEKPPGTPCSDGDSNTVDDRCIRGACIGTDLCVLVRCEAKSSCRVEGTCDPATGTCNDPPAPDGTECDDGDSQTGSDKCYSGVCMGIVSCGGSICLPSEPQCHTASCNNGQCSQQRKVDLTPCNDGDLSTATDHCLSGTCIGVNKCASVVCTAISTCHEKGFCNPVTGECSTPFIAEGTQCDDRDVTTSGDKCINGQCIGSVICGTTTCQVTDTQCHSSGCSAVDGSCIELEKADGTTCNDGRSQTTDDQCVSGQCIGTEVCASITCTASDQCHNVGICNPNQRLCSDPRKPQGTQCNDGDPTTGGDKCVNGACVGTIQCGGSPCAPTNPQCYVAACAGTRCTQVPKPNNTPCNDENPNTSDDKCNNGQCLGINLCQGIVCSSSDQCHAVGVCHPSTGKCSDPPQPDGSLCNDGDLVTSGDQCISGVCIGTIQCGASGACAPTMGRCNTAACENGLCTERAKPNSVSCNDDNPATNNDKCIQSVCVGSIICGGQECLPTTPQCHVAVCENRQCSQQVKSDGTQCSDGSLLTTEDRCVSGVCIGTNKCSGVRCDPSDSCHLAGTCDPNTGLCSDPVKPSGSICDDGDASTSSDRCVAGTCVGSVTCGGSSCVPVNPSCYTAACSNNQVCTEKPRPAGTPCNDNNPLTIRDVCSNAVCVGTSLCAGITCNAFDSCHKDGVCNPFTGICTEPIKSDGTVCTDGDSSTAGDKCLAGVCTGSISCGGVQCVAPDPQCQTPVCSQNRCVYQSKTGGLPCNDGNPRTRNDKCTAGECRGIDQCAGVTCPSLSTCHTEGQCIPATGLCTQPRKADGTPCDDGVVSTKSDVCIQGSCVGVITCTDPNRGTDSQCQPYEPQCHIPVCIVGGCSQIRKADGTSCDDSEPSTAGDKCIDGTCIGTVTCNNTVCVTPSEQCRMPTCSGSQCIEVNRADGTLCDDGDSQTTEDNCKSGKCGGINKCLNVVCQDLPSTGCKETTACRPETGLCPTANKPEGTSCDDNNPQTTYDTCYSGKCIGALQCGENNDIICPTSTLQCIESACTPNTKICTEVNKPDGTTCNDGNPETYDDRCMNGICSGWLTCDSSACIASNPSCQTVRCSSLANGRCEEVLKPDGTPCTDHNSDTVNDICRAGVCGGTDLCKDISCTASDQCHDIGICQPTTGTCTDPSKSTGSVCSDGIATTFSDKCVGGSCVGTISCGGVTCSPSESACHIAVCQDGKCVENAKIDGAACNDQNSSTVFDSCRNGRCIGEDRCASLVCDASDQCHLPGRCISATGLCTDPIKQEGVQCDDGDPTTLNDRCIAGVCTGTITCGGRECFAQSPQCHTSGCDATGQCIDVIKADTTSCNDGNWTTIKDQCQTGICVGTPDHCRPSPCGSQQLCASHTGFGDTRFTCTCRSPDIGYSINKPADCGGSGITNCVSSNLICKSQGQACVKLADPNQWMCVCEPPLLGSQATGAATCKVSDKNAKVATVSTSRVFPPQVWAVRVAKQLGIDPGRVLVSEQGASGMLQISFHGAADESRAGGAYPLNHLEASVLQSEFLHQAATCPTSTTFCQELAVSKINYAATPCTSLTVDLCKLGNDCTWATNEGCTDDDDDRDFVWHLRWILPVVGVLILMCIIAYCWTKRKNAAARHNLKAETFGMQGTDNGTSNPLAYHSDAPPTEQRRELTSTTFSKLGRNEVQGVGAPELIKHGDGMPSMSPAPVNFHNSMARSMPPHGMSASPNHYHSPALPLQEEHSYPTWKEVGDSELPHNTVFKDPHLPSMSPDGRGASMPPTKATAPSGLYPVKV